MHQTSVLLGALFVSLTFLIGCAQDSDRDSLPVPDAKLAGITEKFPNVVRVETNGRLCSGSFISTKAVITASHCVKEGEVQKTHSELGDFSTTTIVRNGSGEVGDTQDIALLLFPDSIVDSKETFAIGEDISLRDTVYLIGYGCTSQKLQESESNQRGQGAGAGARRIGTNVIYRISRFLELLTPYSALAPKEHGILGPVNRAGSCFGDSGGPLLKKTGEQYHLVGVDHAGTTEEKQQVSQYINLSRSENKDFLNRMNEKYDLKIKGLK